jgi:L-iditol 2-dehydrogenase
MRNRAAVLYGVHDLRMDEVPVPEPGHREVLVEVRAIGGETGAVAAARGLAG